MYENTVFLYEKLLKTYSMFSHSFCGGPKKKLQHELCVLCALYRRMSIALWVILFSAFFGQSCLATTWSRTPEKWNKPKITIVLFCKTCKWPHWNWTRLFCFVPHYVCTVNAQYSPIIVNNIIVVKSLLDRNRDACFCIFFYDVPKVKCISMWEWGIELQFHTLLLL